MDKQTPDGTMEHKTLPFIVTKIDEEKGIVTHTVAVMGNVDLGNDVIHPGAFTKTINERMGQIRVLDSHNTDSITRVLGRPIAMREISAAELPVQVKQQYPDANGALMAETQFQLGTQKGREAFQLIKSEDVNEYSIGYEPLDFDFEEIKTEDGNETIRNLRTIKLFEYSPVIFAMNPATSTVGVKNDSGASLQEKAALAIYDEKRNLSEIVKSVHIAFYSQYPDTHDEVFWVKEVHDDFLIVDQEGRANATWKVGYTDTDGVLNFTPKGEWSQVERVFIPIIKEAKIGRAISAANAGRMQSVIDGIQASLANLEAMLQGPAPADEEASAHEDEEKQETPEPSESHQETPGEAGPDVEPPTSKIDLLAELETYLAEIDQMEAK